MAWSSPRTWVTSEVVTAAHMNQEIRDNFLGAFPNQMASVDWDPQLEAVTTNPSVSVNGQRYRWGAMEFLAARFTFSAIAQPFGSGIYFVTLPNAAVGLNVSTTAGAGQVVGSWQSRDVSVPQQTSGEVLLRAADQIQFQTAGTGLVNSGGPWIWASGDILSFSVQIPIA